MSVSKNRPKIAIAIKKVIVSYSNLLNKTKFSIGWKVGLRTF